MRVLFIPLALSSHYYPMVPLAWAFRAAGHEVRIAGQPPVQPSVRSSGLLGIEVAASMDLMAKLESTEDEFLRETGLRLADFGHFDQMPAEAKDRFVARRYAIHLEGARQMAVDIIPFVRAWGADLVVTDLVTVAGPLVSGALGIPLVQHSWGPQFPSTARQPGYGSPVESWPAPLRELFDRVGVPTRETFALCTVDPCPASLQAWDVSRRFLARFVPYNGTGAIPDWATRPPTRPRVCVTWGISSVGMVGMREHPVRRVVHALAALDVEVVVSVRKADRAELGELPDGVHVAQELPLQLIMPGSMATVHHGGGGTLLTAAAYGVPQVVLPQEPTGVLAADLLAACGAGIGVPVRSADERDIGDRVAAEVALMLDDDSRLKAARAVQEENEAQPAPAQTVLAIEQMVADVAT